MVFNKNFIKGLFEVLEPFVLKLPRWVVTLLPYLDSKSIGPPGQFHNIKRSKNFML